MDAYGISTHFDEDAIENGYEPDSKEYNDYVQDCYNQNVEYTIWKIKDDVTESKKNRCGKNLTKSQRSRFF